ncbi:hypothetical protein, partial [Streptococcus pseudopneumoniae]|uniref:hypothetical protein n=1 Tax=Streptococcus pseudopneumoniae TaxID=257758 RepID=UPI0018B0D289
MKIKEQTRKLAAGCSYWTKIKKHLIIVVMKLTNEETQKIEQLLRDSSYAKYHKRLQIIYFRS